MARRATEPVYYESRHAYYTVVKGKQVPLAIGPKGGTTLAAAWEKFHKVHAAHPAGITDDTELYAVFEAHLAWVDTNREAKTLEARREFLQSFQTHFGQGKKVADLKRNDVTRWLDANPSWGQSTRALALRCLKAALNWAVDQELLTRNPVDRYRANDMEPRVTLITREQHEQLHARFARRRRKDFARLLECLWETGARPGELARATALHVDFERRTITLERHKTARKTRKLRVIYLSPRAFELVSEAAREHPKGRLFPNAQGGAYNDRTLAGRFRDARDFLGLPADITPYSYRHTYATDWLRAGKPVAVLAELLGTSIQMIQRHYGHLAEHADSLRQWVDGFSRR